MEREGNGGEGGTKRKGRKEREWGGAEKGRERKIGRERGKENGRRGRREGGEGWREVDRQELLYAADTSTER